MLSMSALPPAGAGSVVVRRLRFTARHCQACFGGVTGVQRKQRHRPMRWPVVRHRVGAFIADLARLSIAHEPGAERMWIPRASTLP